MMLLMTGYSGMFSEKIDHATIVDFQRFSLKVRRFWIFLVVLNES